MSKTLKQYIEREGQTFNVSVWYDLGGINYFSGGTNKRGFYLSVTPCTLEKSSCGKFTTETSACFSGYKKLLIECKRFSKKKQLEAVEASKQWIEELVKAVLAKQKEKAAV